MKTWHILTTILLLAALPQGVLYAQKEPIQPMVKGSWTAEKGTPKTVHFVYGTTLTADDIDQLSTVESLTGVRMGFAGIDSEFVTLEADLLKLGRLKNLEIVHLNKDGIVDKDLKFIAALGNIHELEFNAKNGAGGCTDRCADHLKRQKSLRTLRIFNGQFTDAFIDAITKGMPKLEELMLDSPALTDESLRLIGERCKRLKSLSISSDHFTSEGLNYLSGLKHLDVRSVNVDGEKMSGKIYKTEVPASAEPLVARSNYKMWIPDDTPSIRCIFAINMRAAGKHLFEQDPEWRALAARTGSAIMFCEFEAKEVRGNGYGNSMLNACDQFATELNRPELKHAPLVLWGHSMGGRVAQDFVRFRPSRVLAMHIALRKLPSSKAFMEEEAAPMKVPALYLMGEQDGKPADMRQHFSRARGNDSPRAWIWLPGQGHWPKGMSFDNDETTTEEWRAWAGNDVVIPWTEAVIQLRLPERPGAKTDPVNLRELRIEDGWLGEVETGKIAAYSQFKREKSKASWFPNEDVAKAWAGFSFSEHR